VEGIRKFHKLVGRAVFPIDRRMNLMCEQVLVGIGIAVVGFILLWIIGPFIEGLIRKYF
jgi:hypothetical protein